MMKNRITNDSSKYRYRSFIENTLDETKIKNGIPSNRSKEEFIVDSKGYFCWASISAATKIKKHD
jgi:hypothetical protein